MNSQGQDSYEMIQEKLNQAFEILESVPIIEVVSDPRFQTLVGLSLGLNDTFMNRTFEAQLPELAPNHDKTTLLVKSRKDRRFLRQIKGNQTKSRGRRPRKH